MTIVYCCTRNWYHYLEVAVYSLLCNNSKVEKVYLFIEDDNMENMSKLSQKFGVEIIVYNYNNYVDKYVKSGNLNTRGYTVAALVRLFVSKIINDDKVIYLDTDTIVLDDISELHELDLKDNIIGGVKDKVIDLFLDYIDLKGLPEDYINSGVLVMDLQKIRERKIDDKFIKLLNKEKFRFPDQDIINKVCQNKILFIDNKFNSSPSCGHAANIKILHYSTVKKDWVKNFPYSQIWYEWEKKYEEFLNDK